MRVTGTGQASTIGPIVVPYSASNEPENEPGFVVPVQPNPVASDPGAGAAPQGDGAAGGGTGSGPPPPAARSLGLLALLGVGVWWARR